MNSCLRGWLMCPPQEDLSRDSSRPDPWCNSKKCVAEKCPVPNLGDRRKGDHAMSLSVGFLLTPTKIALKRSGRVVLRLLGGPDVPAA